MEILAVSVWTVIRCGLEVREDVVVPFVEEALVAIPGACFSLAVSESSSMVKTVVVTMLGMRVVAPGCELTGRGAGLEVRLRIGR